MAQKTIYLNGISEKCIWHNTKSSSGKGFASISIPYSKAKVTKGNIGYISVALEEKQVYPAKNFKTKEIIPGKFNAALGGETQTRDCTYLGKDGKGHTIRLTNAEIEQLWLANVKAVKAYAEAHA